jgi:hypothetical protein
VKWAAAAALALAVLAARPARADLTKDQCVDANTHGQALRLDGKLSAARQQLETCNDARCPQIVREDCAARLDELGRAQPTLSLDVVAPNGGAAWRLAIDGKDTQDALGGATQRLDPGKHTLTFTAEGRPPYVRELLLQEAEKRRERVELPLALPAPPPPVVTGPAAPAPPAALPPDDAASTRRTWGAVAMGVGGASAVVGAVFGVLTGNAASRQKRDCASPSACADRTQALADHTAAQTDGAISTIAFAAGAVLLVGGGLVFFDVLGGTGAPAKPVARVSVAPASGMGGAGFALRGEF